MHKEMVLAHTGTCHLCLPQKNKKYFIQQKIFLRFDAVLIQKEILKNKKSRSK